MNTIKILLNPFEQSEYEIHETDKPVAEYLSTLWDTWPQDAHLFHKSVSAENDVTPFDTDSINAVNALTGEFYVVVVPKEAVSAFMAMYGAYVAIAVAVVAAVVVATMAKNIPNAAAMANATNQSGNNELSRRTNKARVWKRIPDIYGTVLSVPDLISNPYKIYDNHIEREFSLMAIGRGKYHIANLADIKDDTTPIQEIDGASVEVYEPFNLTTPQYRVGKPIDQQFYNVKRSNSVNGQVLKPYKGASYEGERGMQISRDGTIRIPDTRASLWIRMAAGRNMNIDMPGFRPGSQVDMKAVVRTITDIPTQGVKFNPENNALMFYGDESKLQQIKVLKAGSTIYLNSRFVTKVVDNQSYTAGCSGFFTIKSVTAVFGRKREKWWLQNNAFLGYRVEVQEPVAVSESIKYPHETLELKRADFSADLSGRYEVLSNVNNVLTLKDPARVNPAWSTLPNAPLQTVGKASIKDIETEVIGPFVCDHAGTTQIIANIVALSGLYSRDKDGEQALNVGVTLKAMQVDNQGNIVGDTYEISGVVQGKEKWQGTRALTLRLTVPKGRYKVLCYRTTPTNENFDGSWVDEIKWRDLYYGSELDIGNPGDITIVKSITNATDGALAVKDRKLNLVVTRMLPQRIGTREFSTTLHPTNYAADIFCAICLDPKNGGRTIDEIDVEGIYDTYDKIKSYFGISDVVEFGYTFDDEDMSFEEMIQSVADATFATAYRTGEKIKIASDTNDKLPVMIFNHRNKIPGSETRSIKFGTQNDYDGIQYKYIDPQDGSQTIYMIPEDGSARKYQSIESLGVRNHRQAYLHAWRLYNMQRYKRISVKFKSLAEADLLVINDRIAVSDNTRAAYAEGEVIKQDGLKVWLSGEVVATAGNYIFFQHWNKTTESIKIAKVEGNVITLERAPSLQLAADDLNYVNSMYIIEASDKISRNKQFILQEKSPEDDMQVEVKAINYDERYYANDHDYMNGNNPYSGKVV